MHGQPRIFCGDPVWLRRADSAFVVSKVAYIIYMSKRAPHKVAVRMASAVLQKRSFAAFRWLWLIEPISALLFNHTHGSAVKTLSASKRRIIISKRISGHGHR